MDRKAPLQSIVNFRDVGIATSGSPALPAGRLYRCSGIDKATKEDQKYLQRTLGISTLIDLNGPKAGGYEFLGRAKEFRKTRQASFDRLDWRKTTTNVLDLSKPQIQAIFLALAQQDMCPVLIYGPWVSLVLCLVLRLLDIPEEKILDEYLLTRQHEAAMLEQVNARRREFGMEEKASLELEPAQAQMSKTVPTAKLECSKHRGKRSSEDGENKKRFFTHLQKDSGNECHGGCDVGRDETVFERQSSY
ncbi:hypothetical protein D0864_05390 [Hortaea werneckii]|uniref:Uncharacterized protein n=1 Tax=Hortaea werneckii TaxID=91943 RepID=A0A3M7G3L6_HORWE|nr:hypothetical protein D0864_05390 [Hortaea werneckii]